MHLTKSFRASIGSPWFRGNLPVVVMVEYTEKRIHRGKGLGGMSQVCLQLFFHTCMLSIIVLIDLALKLPLDH